MKGLLFVASLVFSAAFARAQSCLKFRNGTFKTSYNGSGVIIKRMGNYLREDSIEPKASVTFTVNWTDDCTYTLKPNEDYYQRFPNTPKNAVITVQLSNIGVNSYTQTSTSNFNKTALTSKVIKIQ